MSNRGAPRIGVALVAAIVLSGLVLASGGTPAQGARGGVHGRPGAAIVTTMTGGSTSVDVRNLPHRPNGANRDEAEEHHGPDSKRQGTPEFAAIGSGISALAAPAPDPLFSFEGLAFGDSCGGTQCGNGHPPDTNGDVGPTYYVQTINTAVGIYDKSTGTRVAAFTFNALMSQGSFGNLCDTSNFGDPVVLYDTFADRWVITDFAFSVLGNGNIASPPGSFQCFAVSQSGDPVSGGWYFYSINITDGLQDYPKLAIWPDGIYMSANVFDFTSPFDFQNVRVWAFDKAAMYAGLPANAVAFDAPATSGGCTVFGLLPSNARAQTGTPPAGRPNLFVSTACLTDRVWVWKFHVDWATPASSTFTGPTTSTTSTGWSQGPDTVPVKDGNDLDTLGLRPMAQNQYAKIGAVESIWMSHTIAGASASQAAVRWYQVPVTGGTIGAALQASTFNPDADNRFMPSLAVDRLGDMAIGYTVASATLHPAIRYAGRLAGDAAGSITLTEASLIDGTGTQTGSCGGAPCERWGDYSAMTLDPNGCTFWYTNEYYTALGLNHHTRIGSFRYAGCTDAPPQDTVAPAVTNPGLSPNAAIPGATVTVTSTATDAVDVASAQKQLDGGSWTSMAAVDGGFGETSEDVTSTITAPGTAGPHQVCVRAMDSTGNTSNGLACSSLTVTSFSLAPAVASASAAQGAPATWTINITRSSFPAAVDMSVTGLPAGTSASFSPDPSGGASSLLTVTTTNCGTITPRGHYTLTVTGQAAGLTRTTTVSLTVTNSAPKMTAPVSTLYGNTILGTSTIRVKTAWSACDADGIKSYTLQRQVNGGSWTTVSLATATTATVYQSLTNRATYRFRVRATDKVSAVSSYVYGPSFTPSISNDSSGLITYTGAWPTGSFSTYYGGTDRYSTVTGASATYTFTGTSAAWVAYKGTTRGAASVYVDGVFKATIDLHATSSTARAQVFAFNWGTSGTHTIKVVVVGTAGHPRIDVDAFVRLVHA